MDKKAFQRYLATGDYTPPPASAEDMSLAEHDARWHPHGYKEGDRCLFRANLDKGDKGDADVSATATPKEGGISGIFTGSAADYAKPSLLKVGTGEGSQVYGWGLYGSTVRGVAEGYADNYDSDEIEYLGEQPPPKIASWAEKNLKAHHGDIDATIQELSTELFPPFKEAAQWLKDNKGSIRYTRKDTPHLYEQTFFTNRAPGDESHLLNWYEPVSDENIKRVMNQYAKENDGADLRADTPSGTITLEDFGDRKMFVDAMKENEEAMKADGASLYRYVSGVLGAEQAASEFLYRAGIDGIKYPVDSFGGKTIKDGDKAGWNYVSFSDDNIRVDRKWRDGEEVDDAVRTKIERYLALDAAPIDPDFESKHPRGNSGNKGQFRKSAKTLAKLDDADAAVRPAPAPQGGGSPSAEYAAIEAKYKGTPEWMKAPNGKPTNLTEKQWVQVRTPSFKKWFGDWENAPENASKVIDSNGEPMVVYHGSPNDFNEFTGGKENNSSWFAENFSYAAEFTRDKGMQGVRHFFLNVRHPLNMRTGDNVVDGYAEISETRHDGGEASPQEIAKIAELLGTSTEDIKTRFANTQIWVITQSREFADHLADQGYDGIKFIEFGENTWGTFQPSQIKSATSNSGSFSPDKESILDSAPVSNPQN